MKTVSNQEIKFDHDYRLDVASHVPLKARGRRIKKTPRTAIISLAAKRAIEGKW
jgi:hypothetical protein